MAAERVTEAQRQAWREDASKARERAQAAPLPSIACMWSDAARMYEAAANEKLFCRAKPLVQYADCTMVDADGREEQHARGMAQRDHYPGALSPVSRREERMAR